MGEAFMSELFDSLLPFETRVRMTLHEAGLPKAEDGWDDEDDVPTCTRSGYHITNPGGRNSKVVGIAILGRTDAAEAVRQGERDALTQQARAALVAAGIEVRVSEYGHLTAVDS